MSQTSLYNIPYKKLHDIFTSRYRGHLALVWHNTNFAMVHSQVTVGGSSVECEYKLLHQFARFHVSPPTYCVLTCVTLAAPLLSSMLRPCMSSSLWDIVGCAYSHHHWGEVHTCVYYLISSAAIYSLFVFVWLPFGRLCLSFCKWMCDYSRVVIIRG